ncbi:MAG: FeoC-like transcriptional regulator [Pontiella sp.]
MLSGILKLLNTYPEALSVQEISLALDIESSALHPMLDLLAFKGRIKKIELPCGTGCAGGCTKADGMIFYKSAG